jgi:hypothetical protein
MIKQHRSKSFGADSRHANSTYTGFLFLLSVAVLAGCADRKTLEVTGMVTFDGKALETGTIQFSPMQGSEGPVAGAEIKNGKFIVKDVEQGLRKNGSYSVSIISNVPSGIMVANPASPTGESEFLENIIPERYNYNSELKVTISPEEANDLLFELSSDSH